MRRVVPPASFPRLPRYCLHKPTGQAFVRLDGRMHYLGRYDSPESKARYRELVDAWRLRVDAERLLELSLGELVLLYLEHAKGYYRKHGEPTSEVGCVEAAGKFLMPHRRRRAADFGPLLLEEVRREMVAAGLARTTVNAQVGRLRRMVRWAVAKQWLRPEQLVALEAVAPLRVGRSEAKETEPVGPVPDEHVEAVLPHLSPPLRAAVEVLRHTGARTGEVLSMRVGDLDLSADPWEYRPRSHKTEHRGRRRVILLGPRARAAVRPLLVADPEAYVFRPRDARGGGPRSGKRPPGRRYHPQALRNAVLRACRKAGVPAWHPHQLRHSAATRFCREGGFDVAQAALGHASPDATAIYAERDLEAVRRLLAAIG
ncbi:MAG TPA: tyrosine-type recombinase/integrase [Planctomycetaceae bacterium]